MSRPEPIRESSTEPIGDAVKELISDVGDLVRSEIRLARAEIVTAAGALVRAAIWISIGLSAVFLAMIFVLLAATLGLASFMPLGLAALVVGVVVMIIGLVAAWLGYRSFKSVRHELTASATRETLQEDLVWLKHHRR